MKVAIAGYGVEGKSSYRYYSEKGDDVTIVDERTSLGRSLPEGAKTLLGEGVLSKLNGFDLVVRTPGLNPTKIITDGRVWSASNEFFAQCPAQIIAVTGTKGKGTTCSLIASILRAAGTKVHLVGNIGVPALIALPEIKQGDVVVYEISSFQLWDMQKSPNLAVVLMIEPDHLDVHQDIDEYVSAKLNITRYQTSKDVVLYHPTNNYAQAIAEKSAGKRVRYSVPDDGQAYVKANTFFIQNKAICGLDALQIPGAHNVENACAAISAALHILPNTAYVEAGLRDFTGLPHRLKFVREVGGVKYYDDSIATTSGSAIAAVRAFSGPKILILGGSDKGVDYQELVKVCQQEDVRVIAIGQTGERIAAICKEKGVDVVRETGEMKDVVQRAASIANAGDYVILSPASASFDQYKSYADRGEKFIEAICDL